MIRRYLERNNKIKFSPDYVDGIKVIRMTYTNLFWANEINFIEWALLGIFDRLSGMYGYRRIMKCVD